MEQTYLLPFLITLFAGLSTAVGGLVVFLEIRKVILALFYNVFC